MSRLKHPSLLFLLFCFFQLNGGFLLADIPDQQSALDDGVDDRAVLTGDFDGDGLMDILRIDWNGNGRQYNILLLARSGGWERWHGPHVALLSGSDRQLYVGDFNGDGKTDVFRADQTGNGSQYNAWFSATDHNTWDSFSGPSEALGGSNRRVYFGDFDGDGTSDVLLARADTLYGNRVYISQGNGNWQTWSSGLDYWLGGANRQIHIGDFDGDGDDDILRIDGGGNGQQYNLLLESDGTGGWTPHFNSPNRYLTGSNRAIYVGDFDGDGTADLFRADGGGNGSQYNAVLTYTGSGQWNIYGGALPVALAPNGQNQHELHLADFNGDSRTDIALANWTGDGRTANRLILAESGYQWDVSSPFPWIMGGASQSLWAGQFTSDNRADLVRADWTADGKQYNRLEEPQADGTWLTGASPDIWLKGNQGIGLAEIPALNRKVTGYEDGNFVAPHIPAVRTSNDGRIGVYIKPEATSPERRFVLFNPESQTQHFAKQPPGPNLISSSLLVPNNQFDGDSTQDGHHLTLCDGSSPFADQPGNGPVNPSACGNNDCYQLHTVTTGIVSGPSGQERQLWVTPITVEVSNPKTAQAAITSVTAGAPVAGPQWAVDFMFEPMFTGDGRLLVFRAQNSNFQWEDHVDSNASNNPSGTYDMAYGLIPETANACDLASLEGPFPLSHAAYHPGLGDRYGFAEYPLRDPEGNAVAHGVDVKGTYPWVDRQGRNVFFTGIQATLHYRQSGVTYTRYTARCVTGVSNCPQNIYQVDDGGKTRGVIVAGLWTRGKMVLLDGDFANIDYGLKQDSGSHREIQLFDPYSAASGDQSGWVRIGTGRDNGVVELPAFGVANTTFIDSLENLFNYSAELKPATPRDVVWRINSGRATGEVAFDDYLLLDAVVVANMNASMTHDDPSYGDSSAMRYRDGFNATSDFTGPGFTHTPRLQNAATGSSVPAYGLAHGNIRIEPAATGGIKGKGLWLDGVSGATFALSSAINDAFYTGVFVDLRNPTESPRQVIGFPGGSALSIGESQVHYQTASQTHSVAIPTPVLALERQWHHLGAQVNSNGSQVTIFWDGFELANFSTAPHSPLSVGDIVLGASPSGEGVRAWLDDFKVLGGTPDLESICNHARGTLIGFDDGFDTVWSPIAASYPLNSHSQLSAQLNLNGQATHERYACLHDYSLDYGILAEDLPAGSSSLRAALQFPEGPVQWNIARPDSRNNGFCLDCHDDGLPAPLSREAALQAGSAAMQYDHRRQPSQPIRLMGGWLSESMFAPMEPAQDQTDPSGTLTDQWLAQ